MSEADRPHATSEADRPRLAEEPRLATRDRARRRPRLPLHVVVALPLALAGLLALLVTGNALRPFDRITTIEARMASKSDYFKDPEVQRLLLEHGIRVDIHRLGSRGIATQSLKGMDVVFPSGQPAAKLILDRQDRSVDSVRPFVTPLVFGTFRDYAETLRKAGVATPQPATAGGRTLYYDLDMGKFMDLLDGLDEGRETGDQDEDGTPERADTWNGIGFDEAGGRSNSGRVLVRTSNVCESNSAGAYMSILAFVANGDSTPGAGEADEDKAMKEAEKVARKIKPLIDLQGMWADEQAESYLSDLGESIAPISVIYEHQYLAHQIDYEHKHHRQDTDRVLLYPTPYALTEPQLISLSDKGDKLVRIIEDDTELRRRAIELGFRVRFSGEDGTSDQLNTYLREHGIQVPTPNRDQTKVYEPDLDVLEEIINSVGTCPPPVQDTP
ncbi:hypothetical protein [Streptomyces sp. NL15-2K]|uniref:hypothetical protein n=1 Tax=Streptomyces sp. NL15-2K TaxID=376149 RepID=UPI000FFAB098|nr:MULTISPECIES: hypothetical protein [Actinomycetes]WKX08662.1 hypothetical protein Q4V64_14670 [Kutzneria buriramensis]GCB49855.1 hypothetical protein SNL152K_7198 [Streptomyces sp. NL15-2K]